MHQPHLRKETEFRGRTVRYDRVGDGPPVVLVHSTPWSSFNMSLILGWTGPMPVCWTAASE